QKVVVETLITSSVGLGALWAVLEESQRRQNTFGRICALEPAIAHPDRIATQSQPGGRDATGRILACIVGYKSLVGICVIEKTTRCHSVKPEDGIRKTHKMIALGPTNLARAPLS